MSRSIKKPNLTKRQRLIGILLGLIVVALLHTPAGAQLHIWSQGFGGTSEDVGFSVAYDSNGNVYMTGKFVGSIDFGGGPILSDAGSTDAFLVKFDSEGVHQWSKAIGDFCEDVGYGVCTNTQGDVFVTGRYCGSSIDFNENGWDPSDPSSEGMGDIFVVKYDGDGLYQWHWTASGSCCGVDYGRAICTDTHGDVWVTGRDEVERYSGSTDYDVFLVKLNDDNGSEEVAYVTFDGPANDEGLAICADGDHVTITGYYSGGVASSTVTFGEDTLTSNGGKDIFLATFDLSGAHVASNSIGSANDDEAYGIALDGNGDVILTGYFLAQIFFGTNGLTPAGGKDVFLAKMNRWGTSYYWSKGFGDVYDDKGNGVAVDDAGDIYITGSFIKSINFGGKTLYSTGGYPYASAIYVAKMESPGDHVWSRKFGYFYYDGGMGVAAHSDGNIALTGYYKSDDVDFGGGDLPYSGDDDVYLVNFSGNDAFVNMEITPVFDPVSYTWDVTFDFGTTSPLGSDGYQIDYYPVMDCYPDPWPDFVRAGDPGDTLHSTVLDDLAAAPVYQYDMIAYFNGGYMDCDGTFQLTNSYEMIYNNGSSFNSVGCRINVFWYTKYPSKDNLLYYRKVGDNWTTREPSQGDCDEDRFYRAHFPIQEGTRYEFKARTKIEGVTYWTNVMSRTAGRCDDDPPIPIKTSPLVIATPFVQANPNPFNPITTLSFNVRSRMDVELSVFSIEGRLVKTLASGTFNAGIHRVEWDATDSIGERVSSGTYFAEFRFGGEALTTKLVLLE